jgi:hypothetical protein
MIENQSSNEPSPDLSKTDKHAVSSLARKRVKPKPSRIRLVRDWDHSMAAIVYRAPDERHA